MAKKEYNKEYSFDIDKYIKWYKNECIKSEKARWMNHDVSILTNLSSQTNYYCETYINKNNAKKYNDRIKEKLSEQIRELNTYNQPIYCPTEWLVPNTKEWQTFNRCIVNNQHISDLTKKLSIAKDTEKAKKIVIIDFITDLKKRELIHFDSYVSMSFVLLNFFDKTQYDALHDSSYMGYCKEHALMGLIYDYLQIKAVEYAQDLLLDIKENNKLNLDDDIDYPKKPIIWNVKDKNILSSIFAELESHDIIKGSKADIQRLILTCFRDINNKPFSRETVKDIFKPSTGKLSTKITDSLNELIKDIKK